MSDYFDLCWIGGIKSKKKYGTGYLNYLPEHAIIKHIAEKVKGNEQIVAVGHFAGGDSYIQRMRKEGYA